MPETDWFHRGYIDWPEHHLYPYRDKQSESDEKKYLTGWWKRARENLLEQAAKDMGE